MSIKGKVQPSLKAMSGKKRVFLDYASITPIDKRVEIEMHRAQSKFWGNPSSLHMEGEEAKKILEEARINIAKILHCKNSEVFFTSGGTESLNLAIGGIVKSRGQSFSQGSSLKNFAPNGDPLGLPSASLPHIIVSSIEHPAVLEPVKHLIKDGEAEASFINPDKNGIINPESIKKEIKENTVLVVVQHANNEIGIIQPVREISKIIKETCLQTFHQNATERQAFQIEGVEMEIDISKSHFFSGRTGGVAFPYLLVDASQSALYEDVSLERLRADILVLDGIKMYGPRGAGILVIRHNIKISPVIFGGGQEGGLRPGTENVAGAAGLSKALEIAVKTRVKESKRLAKLRDYAINKILKEIPGASLNGGIENRLPNNINICFKNIQGSQSRTFSKGLSLKNFVPKSDFLDSEFLVIKLDTLGFAVSAASACHTLSLENSSYVVEMVSGKECASSSLRFTLGRSTKKSDLDALVLALKKIVK